MSGCDHDPTGTPELDAEVALRAMAEGDLPHAAFHVAAAVAADPERADLLALLDQLKAAAGGLAEVLALYPVEGGTWYGAAALRGRLLLEVAPDDGLDLLCQVAVVKPGCGVLPWAAAAADRVDPDGATGSVARLLRLDTPPASPDGQVVWAGALRLMAALRERFPDHESLATLQAMITRRAGRFEEAFALAVENWRRFPSWRAAVAWANAARATGRWEEAERAWVCALEQDPDDLSVRLDWGDALLERGEPLAARRKYEEVLAREPAHPWAVPSALYADWARHPTVTARLLLRKHAVEHPDQPRAQELADHATPWVGRLPEPWLARGTPPEPEPPEPAAAGVIAELAPVDFHAEHWLRLGAELARDASVGSAHAADLSRLAHHPPTAPDDVRAWPWRVAHAVAFVLVGFPGWADTPHREALRALLDDPSGWTGPAALAALAERGRGDPSCRDEVLGWMVEALADPALGWPAACALHRLGVEGDPDLHHAVLRELRVHEDPSDRGAES